MKKGTLIRSGLLGIAAFSFWTAPAFAQVIVPGSVTNATVDSAMEGDTLDKAFDDDYLGSRARLDGVAAGDISFVIDLEAPTVVTGLAFYGAPDYRASQNMLGGTITIESGDSATGPWTVIGTRDVGSVRPTDPDPTVGGVNAFTGGNGRLISTDDTTTQYLRVTGGQDYDSTILIYDIQISPRLTLHQINPVWQGTANLPFDPGGGPANSRVGADLTDGSLLTRTFMGAPNMEWVFDMGEPKELAEMRFHCSDNDEPNMLRTGELWVSSTDDPTNFDTKLMDFDTRRGGQRHAQGMIFIPQPAPSKRYYQVRPLTNNTGAMSDGTNPTFRLSEVDYRTRDNAPVRSASIFPGSLENGVSEGDQPPERAINYDYLTAWGWGQTGDPARFVVDLGGTYTVDSVGMYGLHFYEAGTLMLSDLVTVEIADAPTGPWTQIGSLDVGNTRPTDPDPTIGGVNPWTGGNGRRVACTPTEGAYIRVSGGYGYDNNIRLAELVVNPPHVAHKVTPVHGPTNVFDFGGGTLNSRNSAEMVDGNFQTRANPQVTGLKMVLDVAPEAVKIQQLRFFPMDNDIGLLPFEGTMRTSSTDDPDNMDTVEVSWNTSFTGGAVVVDVPTMPEKKYVEIEFSASTLFRAGEIEVIPVPELGGASSVDDWNLYAY